MSLIPLFAPGGFGSPELIIILLIAVLLFGANKIPKLARSTGQAIGEFQRGREEIEDELENVRETASVEGDVTGSDSTVQSAETDAQEPASEATSGTTSDTETDEETRE